MLKTCQFCGKVYKTYQSNRMFCSISCSNNAKIKGNEIKIFNDFAKIIVNSKKFGIKEVLKSLKRSDKIKDESREMSEKLKIENIRYRKALEEIKKVLSHCVMTGAIVKILYIINKAKGDSNE